jgi:hypothetical protein
MEKYLVSNEEEWERNKYDIRGVNLSYEQYLLSPEIFPCIVIIAYEGEGWDEMDFVYEKDFHKIIKESMK